jgi:hypothetical protein
VERYFIEYPSEEVVSVDQANYCKFVQCGFPVGTRIYTGNNNCIIRKNEMASAIDFGVNYPPMPIYITQHFEWPGMFGE